jgi:hypothetical protein
MVPGAQERKEGRGARPRAGKTRRDGLTKNRRDLYHLAAEVAKVHSGCHGKLSGEPGVRSVALEQSGGLVWFGANRNPYCLACC